MNRDELIDQTKRLISRFNDDNAFGRYAEACEFLRMYGGPRNSFLATLEQHDPLKTANPIGFARSVLRSFLDYLEAGLYAEVSPERRAHLDIVSDFLEMSNALLETNGVHPGAPAMLIGAPLEEFLRTWVKAEGLPFVGLKPGIETYSQILRTANLIGEQVGKDTTSWAGIRNHAAHGEWNEVADKIRVMLMLEGVNLFMRKYSPK